jgi:hypothetical protein
MQMIACFLLDFSAAGVPVQHLSTFLAELSGNEWSEPTPFS